MPTPLLDNRQLGTDTARANLLTNGGFEVWQRGNGPFTTSLCADTWRIGTVGTDTLSVSRNTATVDTGSVASAACTFALGTGAGGTQIFQQFNLLGDGPNLQGRTITLSMRVLTATANAVRIGINNLYASASHWTYSTFHPGGGTWQTLTVTAAIDPTATYIQLGPFFAASCTAYLDNATLVVGSVPADYAPLHPADDLARCLRYYEVIVEGNSGAFTIGTYNTAGASFYTYTPLKVTKGGNPTITAGTWQMVNCSTPSIPGYSAVRGIRFDATIAATGYGYFQPGASPANFVTAEWNP